MDPRTRRNFLCNAAGEAFWGLHSQMIAASTVLTVLLVKFGASDQMIGALSSIERGLLAWPQVLGAMAFRSVRHRKRHFIIYHLIAMIPFLFAMSALAAFAPHLSPAAVRWGLLGCFAGFQFTMGMITSVWFDWVAHLFDRSVRGTVMGTSFALAWTAGLAGAYLAGEILGPTPTAHAFACLYALAGGTAVASILTFGLIDDPAQHQPDRSQHLDFPTMRRTFAASLRSPNFRTYMLGQMLPQITLILPFLAVYYSSPAGGGLAPDRLVQTAGIAGGLGAALGQLTLGRLGDRVGHVHGLLLATAAGALALRVISSTSGFPSAVAAYALAGFAGGGGFVANMNLLIETCPHDHRLAHMTLGSLLLAPGLLLFPYLAGQLAAHFGIPLLLLTCLATTLAALLWFALLVRDPRHVRCAPPTSPPTPPPGP